ncbi:hypothetical protein [Crossiella cryophila]|uniref:Uncharacterized protein n=1 Tax=Crossiella cryophila TaxID=43355 RepID=A0A7W7CE99_9PSEU|nr:hypothetical protein [Crossiella cryophila]MBB4677944.1 hypothetical protein [Crossiella cryophila]
MTDASDIDKAEYDSLRAESLFHQTNASAIFGLNLVGMGVGITASSKIDAALLVLAVISCVLWLRYCDHLMAVFRIAAYLNRHLRPRLVAGLGEPVLDWENFLRSAGSDDRTRMPRLPSADSRIGFIVASLGFMLPPPLLCATFLTQRWSSEQGTAWTPLVLATSLAVLMWMYSMGRGYQVMRWIRATDRWISGSP